MSARATLRRVRPGVTRSLGSFVVMTLVCASAGAAIATDVTGSTQAAMDTDTVATHDADTAATDDAAPVTTAATATAATQAHDDDLASLARPFELPPWHITLGAIVVLGLGLASGWRLGRRLR